MGRSIFSPDGTYTQHYKTMCWNKYWYESENQAIRAAYDYMDQNDEYGKRYRVYKCEYCSGFHLTSKRPNISHKHKANKSSCKGKKKYREESHAKQAARDRDSTWYYCQVCHQYHLN